MDAEFLTQYNHLRSIDGAGILQFSNHGLIEVSGGEAVQFLNGLITNDVKKLADNSWLLAAFPNAQGRLLALVRVVRRGDKYLFITDEATREKVLQNLFRFTFAGDFKVADLSEEFQLVAVRGNGFSNFDWNIPTANEVAQLDFSGEKITLIAAAGESGFDALVPRGAVLQDFLRHLKTRGAIEITSETREVLRVENGVPRYNVDMDETTIVLETGLDDAVSFTKGCYVGQEIIARIHFRGHVAKKLTGLMFEETAQVAAGDNLKSATGKAAGRITSTVFSPILNKQIALALVRYEFLQPETELFVVNGETELRAKVAELPFVK